MKRLTWEGSQLPEVQILGRSYPSAEAVESYLRRYWRTVPDPAEAEFVRHPRYQIQLGMQQGYYEGDCDDAATFAGAILRSVGYPCRFIAYRLRGQREFNHVNLVCGDVIIDPVTPLDQLPVQGVEEVIEVWL